MGGLESAADPHRPLANLPGGLCLRTQADLLRGPPESAADPKIRREYAADPPQVHIGVVDLFVMKRN